MSVVSNWQTYTPSGVSVHARGLARMLVTLGVVKDVRVFPFEIYQAQYRRIGDSIEIRMTTHNPRAARVNPQDIAPLGLMVDQAKLGNAAFMQKLDVNGQTYIMAKLPIQGW